MSKKHHHKHHHHHHDDCNSNDADILEKLVAHCCNCKDDRRCKQFSREDACRIANQLGINTSSPCFDLDEFWKGLNMELEHGTVSPGTNITNNDPIMTGKIALAHLNEIPDYYTRETKMRKEALKCWCKAKCCG